MKKKVLILMLLLVTNLAPVISRPVMLRARSTFQRGCMRMPSATHISSDFDNGILTLSISAYTGDVQICVYDSDGNLVDNTISSVLSSGMIALNLDSLSEGDYTLTIFLNNAEYSGCFYV